MYAQTHTNNIQIASYKLTQLHQPISSLIFSCLCLPILTSSREAFTLKLHMIKPGHIVMQVYNRMITIREEQRLKIES